MDFELLFPGRFIKSAQFNGRDVTMTIKAVVLEELEGIRGKQQKGIVSFEERPLQWVLNRTNASALKAMFGRETNGWVGKRVTLYPAPFRDLATDEETTAIRVRGSPDLKVDLTFELALPRKKPVQVKLARTGSKPSGKPTPPPPPEPGSDMTDDEKAAAIAAENAEAARRA